LGSKGYQGRTDRFRPPGKADNLQTRHFCCGSKASVWRSVANFRSAPINRHVVAPRQTEAMGQFQTRLGVPIQAAFWRIEYHGYSHLYGPMIFLIVALCIDRGVRRFEKAAILFARPATTIALPFESAAIPPAATGEGNLCADGGITRMIRVSSRLVQPQLHPNRHELG